MDWGDGAGWQLVAADTTAEEPPVGRDYDADALHAGVPAGGRSGLSHKVKPGPDSSCIGDLVTAAISTTSSVWLDLRIAMRWDTSDFGTQSAVVTPGCWNPVTVASNTAPASYLFYGCSGLQSVSVATTARVVYEHVPGLLGATGCPQVDTSSGTNFFVDVQRLTAGNDPDV